MRWAELWQALGRRSLVDNDEPQRLISVELGTEPNLQQLDNMFLNITWAREQISGMLEDIAEHEDGHDCPPYCLPGRVGNFLMALPYESLLILISVMLKDSVIEEDTGDIESEDVW